MGAGGRGGGRLHWASEREREGERRGVARPLKLKVEAFSPRRWHSAAYIAMSARQRAQSRLDAALNAAGGPKPLRDECQKPREPCGSPVGSVLLSTKEESSLHASEKERAGEGGLEELLMLGSAAVNTPPSTLAPVDSLITRRQGLADRLETMQTEGLKARSMLREVEALVRRAIDEELEEEFVPSSASSKPASAPNSARAGLGGRLAPSRGVAGMAGGGPMSARAAAGGRAAPYAGGAGAHAAAERADDGAPSGSSRPGSASSVGASVNHSDAIKARRLEQCAAMEAQLASMRGALDGDDASLSGAAKDNARLARRAADALSFSADELEAEIAMQAEADEEANDAWEASMAADLANARTRMVAARVALAENAKAAAAAAASGGGSSSSSSGVSGGSGGGGSGGGSRAAAASRARRVSASQQRLTGVSAMPTMPEGADEGGSEPFAWSAARHDLAAARRQRERPGEAQGPHTPPRLPGHAAAGRRPAPSGRGGGGRGGASRGPSALSQPVEAQEEVELR